MVLPKRGLQIAPEKIQKGESVNDLSYKIVLQKTRTQKEQIRRYKLRLLVTFKDC